MELIAGNLTKNSAICLCEKVKSSNFAELNN